MVGDRIVFQKSNKDLQIQNSEFATLTSVNKNEFVAKTDNDSSKQIFRKPYRNL
ncbi:conjugal transfer protein TraA [Orientia tsutsugamushi]|uniref:Conjugal transfer protein TraA n=2 Tax=Orientia tsutsugamushi TaxID=784 RepID=A0A2U3QX70_ORITS|nr:hypothetical protein [Orientia tsutsugamushi]BAG41354.1 putative conjugative transfer protein TraA [Orientia tsutsugamushi str. Ikeda]SPR05557.1 conjugal transfer protein TraA [Orientia tsutsugamushi]